jgi:hypothetical protein
LQQAGSLATVGGHVRRTGCLSAGRQVGAQDMFRDAYERTLVLTGAPSSARSEASDDTESRRKGASLR